MERVNLREKLALFSDHWSPKVVGDPNGQQVKLVKFRGEFVWQHHLLREVAEGPLVATAATSRHSLPESLLHWGSRRPTWAGTVNFATSSTPVGFAIHAPGSFRPSSSGSVSSVRRVSW